jgi:hypothetical protein
VKRGVIELGEARLPCSAARSGLRAVDDPQVGFGTELLRDDRCKLGTDRLDA